MASNKKEVAKFYLPKKDAEFAPYEYREEEGNVTVLSNLLVNVLFESSSLPELT